MNLVNRKNKNKIKYKIKIFTGKWQRGWFLIKIKEKLC